MRLCGTGRDGEGRAEEGKGKEGKEENERTSRSESLFGEKNGGGGLVSDSGNELVVDDVDLSWLRRAETRDSKE